MNKKYFHGENDVISEGLQNPLPSGQCANVNPNILIFSIFETIKESELSLLHYFIASAGTFLENNNNIAKNNQY